MVEHYTTIFPFKPRTLCSVISPAPWKTTALMKMYDLAEARLYHIPKSWKTTIQKPKEGGEYRSEERGRMEEGKQSGGPASPAAVGEGQAL